MQTLVALHPTERLSPWRQVWKNIHFRVWIPGLAWSVLHPGGPPAPSWFPLVPSDLGIWTSPPWRLSWTPVQGGYPQYHSILSSPQEGFTPSPLTPRFKCFLTTKIFAHLLSSAVFFYSVNCKELQRTALNAKAFTNRRVYFARVNLEYSNLSYYYCDLAKIQDCRELWNFEILIDSAWSM